MGNWEIVYAVREGESVTGRKMGSSVVVSYVSIFEVLGSSSSAFVFRYLDHFFQYLLDLEESATKA